MNGMNGWLRNGKYFDVIIIIVFVNTSQLIINISTDSEDMKQSV